MTRKAKKSDNNTKNDSFSNQREDAFYNSVTGLNISGRDSSRSFQIGHSLIQQEFSETLYAGSAIARKIIDTIPYYAFKEGYEFVGIEKDAEENIREYLKKLRFDQKLQNAWVNGRLYGGGLLLIGVADGKNLSDPLDVKSVKSITSLTPLSRWKFESVDSINQDIRSENYGKPEFYKILNSDESIHYSRLIRFDGNWLPDELFKKNSYWHDSFLGSIYQELEGYDTSHNMLSRFVNRFVVGILKGKYKEKIWAGEGEKVLDRLKKLGLAESLFNKILIDDEESYELKSISVTGIESLMNEINRALVASSNIPHTVLFGDSPSGSLSTTGESERKDFYDRISYEQKNTLRPAMEYLLNICINSSDFPSKGLKSLEFKFNSLFQLNESEEAKKREAMAKADAIYVQSQVLTPQEVAVSRFGSDNYSIETQLDKDTNREKIV